jgi:hypothetical protein
MKARDFIEKAKEGGYPVHETAGAWESQTYLYLLVLDSKAWEAVGKVEGWDESFGGKATQDLDGVYRVAPEDRKPEWQFVMHGMIDALIQGKTVEEYLETL